MSELWVVKSRLVSTFRQLRRIIETKCLTAARPGEPSYLPPVAALPRKPFPHIACLSAYLLPLAPRSFVQRRDFNLFVLQRPQAPQQPLSEVSANPRETFRTCTEFRIIYLYSSLFSRPTGEMVHSGVAQYLLYEEIIATPGSLNLNSNLATFLTVESLRTCPPPPSQQTPTLGSISGISDMLAAALNTTVEDPQGIRDNILN